MEPLQRGQRLMRVQTVNELQGIRQHSRNSTQHDIDDRCMRRKQANRKRQPNAGVKSDEGRILEDRPFPLQVITVTLCDRDRLEGIIPMRNGIDRKMAYEACGNCNDGICWK